MIKKTILLFSILLSFTTFLNSFEVFKIDYRQKVDLQDITRTALVVAEDISGAVTGISLQGDHKEITLIESWGEVENSCSTSSYRGWFVYQIDSFVPVVQEGVYVGKRMEWMTFFSAKNSVSALACFTQKKPMAEIYRISEKIRIDYDFSRNDEPKR